MVLSRLARRRSWLAAVAVALVLLSLLPPAGTYARRQVFAESLQFILFATVVPALLLLGAPWRLPGLFRPLRAVFAAAAMWTIWVVAYILGFSQVAWFSAYAHAAGLSPVVDQEIATGIMWAVPALCFIPVVYVCAMTWLKDTEDADEGLRAIVQAERPQPGPGRWPRPPRGWDTHSA